MIYTANESVQCTIQDHSCNIKPPVLSSCETKCSNAHSHSEHLLSSESVNTGEIVQNSTRSFSWEWIHMLWTPCTRLTGIPACGRVGCYLQSTFRHRLLLLVSLAMVIIPPSWRYNCMEYGKAILRNFVKQRHVVCCG